MLHRVFSSLCIVLTFDLQWYSYAISMQTLVSERLWSGLGSAFGVNFVCCIFLLARLSWSLWLYSFLCEQVTVLSFIKPVSCPIWYSISHTSSRFYCFLSLSDCAFSESVGCVICIILLRNCAAKKASTTEWQEICFEWGELQEKALL